MLVIQKVVPIFSICCKAVTADKHKILQTAHPSFHIDVEELDCVRYEDFTG
jgi:hypothetical protein